MSLEHIKTRIEEYFTFEGRKYKRSSLKGRPLGFQDTGWLVETEEDLSRGLRGGYTFFSDDERIERLESEYQKLQS